MHKSKTKTKKKETKDVLHALMAIFDYYRIVILIVTLFIFPLYLLKIKSQTKGSTPTNWPVIGMLPALYVNAHRFHDYITQILKDSGGTFEFKGPPFTNTDMLLTCDPNNIQHIFTKRFMNYPKGDDFQKIFDVLGDGIFSSDFKLWELHRKATLSLLNGENFYLSLQRAVLHKVDTGLQPLLDHFSQRGTAIDMQDVLQRFAFDAICQFFLHHDPLSLSIDFPNVPCEKALGDALEPLLYRHIVPEQVWRIQRWLNIGKEKILMESWKAFDDFIYPLIGLETGNRKHDLDAFESFRKAYAESREVGFPGDLNQFLRDTFLGLLFAGRDSLSVTLTWLFSLLSSNPSVETKIREEIKSVFGVKERDDKRLRFFGEEECDKLIYLHAAICETLRLYPPIALENKRPVEHDVLPSTNQVRANMRIIVSFYSTGRMESVWGKDCMEFKPERWILPGGGGIKHESSFKFPAFNVGPRTCPGKKMAFIEMKIVAASIIHRFNVRVVEGHRVSPREAVILKAKNGLMVSLSRT